MPLSEVVTLRGEVTCQEGQWEQALGPISVHDLPGTFRVSAHTHAQRTVRFNAELLLVLSNPPVWLRRLG